MTKQMEIKQIIGKQEPKMVTIDVGTYMWCGRQPIPKCDSCGFNDATHKIFTKRWREEVGIRLCEECLGWLKTKLAKIKTGDM